MGISRRHRGPALVAVVRVLRCCTFGAVMTVLAACAHTLGGGMVPGPRITALALVVVTLTAYPGTRREAGFARVLVGTAAWQVCLHVAFELSMASACAVPGSSAGSVSSGPGWADLVPGHGSGWMVAAHAVAGLAAAWWLRRGERCALRLLGLVLAALAPAARVIATAVSLLARPAGVSDVRGSSAGWVFRDLRPSTGSAGLAGSLTRRGPPRVDVLPRT